MDKPFFVMLSTSALWVPVVENLRSKGTLVAQCIDTDLRVPKSSILDFANTDYTSEDIFEAFKGFEGNSYKNYLEDDDKLIIVTSTKISRLSLEKLGSRFCAHVPQDNDEDISRNLKALYNKC